MRSALPLLLTVILACAPSDRELAVSESAATNWCPPIPPGHPNVEIHAVSPDRLVSGSLVTFEGKDFDKLPPGTQAWFRSDGNGWTATGPFVVDSPTSGRAVVPSHHLVVGPGQVSLYYSECTDCTAQGGGANDCAGTWVNPRARLIDVEFVHPLPKPLPVSHLTAVAESDTVIQLSWRDNSNNEDYFEVLQGPDPAGTQFSLGTVMANQTSEPITQLQPNTTYCYEVRAVNRTGHHDVPDEAKACATTFAPSIDRGTVEIRRNGSAPSTICPATIPNVALYAFVDSNRDGIVNAFGVDALPDPGPAWLVPNVLNEPAWNIFVANGYAPGANMIVLANIMSCGAEDPQFVALHMYWDGVNVRPIFYLAGNYRERTGPGNEAIGSVMITSELGGAIDFDPRTNRVRGSIRAPVSFHVEIPGSGIAFDSQADVTLDFSNGVEVGRE